MRKTFTGIAVVAILVAIIVGGCKRYNENSIHIGVILSLTGAAAPYGQDNLHGLQVAQEVLNERGGIRNKKIELDIQDSTGDAAQAVTLTQRFASDKRVIGILGPTRTGETVAVAKLLPNLQLPMMSVGSTGDWKSAGGDFNDWTFRSTRVDTYLIEPLLRTARDDFGVKKIAIISTANDDYSKSVEPVYEQVAQQLGIQVVGKESQMTGDTDRSAQLTKIKAAQPDALIVNTLASDAPTIADQARKIGITARFLGTAGFTNPSTWKNAGAGVLEGTIVAENFFPGSARPAVKEFVERYQKKFGNEPPPYAAYAYDGLMLFAQAIGKATDPNSRQSVRDALGNTKGYEGVLGTLTYHGKGDAEKTPVILQIQNGKYVQLK